MAGDFPAGDGVGGANAADIGAGLNGVKGRNKIEAGSDFHRVDAAADFDGVEVEGDSFHGVEDSNFIGVEY